ncbi:MAG: ATP-binding protein [Bacteroidales bacterium]
MAQATGPFVRLRWLAPLAVLLTAALAIILVWVGFAAEINKDRERAAAAAEIRLGSVAFALAEQVERSLSGIDVMALYLRHAWATNREHFPEVVDTLRPVNALTSKLNVMINDADGWIVYSTYPPTSAPVNFADREHFRVQADSAADELFVSKPVLGKISQRMMLPCSRKLLDASGKFAGIAVVAIAAEDLFRVDDHLNLGARGGATLVGLDGVVRASFGRTPGTVAAPGMAMPADRPYMTEPYGVFQADSVVDGEARMFAFRRLRQFPLVMVVTDTMADITAATQPHRRELGLFAATATAVIAAFGLLIAHFLYTLGRRNAALDVARRRSELILRSAGEGICGFDGKGQVTFINPAARRMLGWDTADAASRDTLIEQLRQMRHAGESKATLCRADGHWFPVELTAAEIVDHDHTDGAVLVFRDVTEAVKTEQALIDQSNALTRSNAELEQFAYVASHDLREPLRMVSSFLALLEKRLTGQLDQDCTEFLNFARDGAQRMDRLVLDLLEYSRIGRLQRPLGGVDLNQVVEEVRRNLAAAIADSGGTVTVAGPLPIVVGDAQELTRLLQNLVGNALKYHASERPPVVEIIAQQAGTEWRVAIKDNGIGIAPEHFARVFGVFQRLHTREQYDGTGIGLAICKKVVEHHGGRIWVESEPGCGSTFTLTLPA